MRKKNYLCELLSINILTPTIILTLKGEGDKKKVKLYPNMTKEGMTKENNNSISKNSLALQGEGCGEDDRCIVLIPTYNEKENIANIIRYVFGLPHPFEILVIDDGSPDGTATIVKQMQDEFPQLHILEREGKLGLGTAYIAGFRWALSHDYDYVFEMDADFSHNPDDLLRLYDACAVGGADLAIGSRYVSGVNVVNWPIGRVLMSYYASVYVRLVTGINVHDSTAGFVCYSRRLLEKMEFDKIRFKGYAFQIEMKFTAAMMGAKIQEVPIIFTNRILGTSKMSGGIFGEAFLGVIKLKISSWTRIYPRL